MSKVLKDILKVGGINVLCLSNDSLVIDLSRYYVGLINISLLNDEKISCRGYVRLMITHDEYLYVGPLSFKKQ